MILTVVITDGRGEYLVESMASLQEMLPGAPPLVINDSGDPDYARWLELTWPSCSFIHHPQRRGLAGAVRSAWQTALGTSADYVWHHEDDFVLTEPVDLHLMTVTLEANPDLAQLVLKRQPVSGEEIAAGGQIETAPDAHVQRAGWVERVIDPLYSFNPHLARRKALECAVTNASNMLERGVTDALVAGGWTVGSYWGRREDPPRCTHIGERRSAGYRW